MVKSAVTAFGVADDDDSLKEFWWHADSIPERSSHEATTADRHVADLSERGAPMKRVATVTLGLACLLVAAATSSAADAALQAKLDAKIEVVKAWAADPVVVAAVKAHNASEPADHTAMTQDKWTALTVLDPFVRSFTKTDAAAFLKTKKTDEVSEAFLSDAKGDKVAFLAKTTNWCHKGKPKHDVPMTGKVWQGNVEVDESTGMQQIQVAVPVMDGGKAIGSLVVGLSVAKM